MTRSKFTPGPETGHYHTTLGVDETTVGQLQQVSLLGPFHIAHDDAGISVDSGVVLADLDPCVITKVAVIVTETFAGDNLYLSVGIADPADLTDWTGIWGTDTAIGGELAFQSAAGNKLAQGAADQQGNRPALVLAPVKLTAELDGTNVTQGEADIYVLIATPA